MGAESGEGVVKGIHVEDKLQIARGRPFQNPILANNRLDQLGAGRAANSACQKTVPVARTRSGDAFNGVKRKWPNR